jgi:hypothetical protein
MKNLVNQKRPSIFIFGFHLFQERIRHYKIRNLMSRILSIVKPKHKEKIDQAKSIELKELEENGFTFFDNILDNESIELLVNELKSNPCYDRWRKGNGEFNIDDVPSNTHVANVKDILQIEKVLDIANNPRVLPVVSAYFGCKPIIDTIHAWWSIPGFDTAENEQFFHRDNDSIKFLKLFIYLTDVDLESGPHIYIKGSHQSNKIATRKRIDDKEVRKIFKSDKFKEYTGAKGTCFLEDTWGIHKGQLPTDKPRLLLQIRYSILPTIFRQREKITVKKEDYKYDKYINQHICKFE